MTSSADNFGSCSGAGAGAAGFGGCGVPTPAELETEVDVGGPSPPDPGLKPRGVSPDLRRSPELPNAKRPPSDPGGGLALSLAAELVPNPPLVGKAGPAKRIVRSAPANEKGPPCPKVGRSGCSEALSSTSGASYGRRSTE
jgi:hypothetical protein